MPRPARVLILFVCATLPAVPLAQEVDEQIRTRVEQLLDTGSLDAAGVPIAARTLIPMLYEAREFAPAWHSATQVDSLLAVIDRAFVEGLDPNDYHVDVVRAAQAQFAAPETLAAEERAELDIALTDAVIRLGFHLRFGKVDPVALDSAWNFSRDLKSVDVVETIQAAIDSRSMQEFANEIIPTHFLYERLKRALAEYRALAAAGGWPVVPSGPTLKAGMRDARVPTLAARLAVTGDLTVVAPAGAVTPADEAVPGDGAVAPASDAAVDPTLYDAALAAAVGRFQERHGLTPDGAVGPQTLAALNVPVETRVEEIRANLERGRWVLGDLEDDFVAVNIAGFRLYVVRDGEVTMNMRVQVGRPYRQTPVFKSRLTYLVFNPTWTVPPTIFRQDFLPELRRDPGYLATRNIDLFANDGAKLDPSTVDWTGRSFPYRLVQRPGPNNALGRVKFMFPNDYSVYLHDTPSRDLFERESRAFSSGCIRVEEPLELALELLGRRWDGQRIANVLASGRTETVILDSPLTVMLLYWTTEVDESGRVYFWPDVYERDQAVIAELAAPFRSPPSL